jgi:hypothetical protein
VSALFLQELVCAAPNVAFCTRKPMMPTGQPTGLASAAAANGTLRL